MLERAKVVAFVATRDPEKAKPFYRDRLGLKLVSEDHFALVFDANGTMLRVTHVADAMPPRYTVLGWDVPDIYVAAKELQGAGIQFERYPGMPQDESGVWQAPSGAKIAWFEDPDGNILSITEFAPERD